MSRFGEDFSGYKEDDENAAAAPAVPTPTPAKALESVDVSKGKKGKLNSKSTGLQYQFQILDLIGIPRDETKQFAKTNHWLEFFPPIAKEDMTKLGARIDWRRQFLTSKCPALWANHPELWKPTQTLTTIPSSAGR